MKDLQEATQKICELKGECLAMQAMFDALLRALPPHVVQQVAAQHTKAAEIARVTIMNSDKVGESVISSFDLHSENMASMVRTILRPF